MARALLVLIAVLVSLSLVGIDLTVLSVFGGALGLHHFYLGGRWRWLGLLYPVPTLVGVAGVIRMRNLGQDDRLSWLLIPWGGLTISIGMFCAIVIGLTSDIRWGRHFAGIAADADPDDNPPGLVRTGWGPVLGVVLALMVGSGVLVGTISFSVQKIFEW